MKESEIESRVCRHADAINQQYAENTVMRYMPSGKPAPPYWYSKFTGQAGVPDRLFSHFDAGIFFIEFKTPQGRLSEIQILTHRHLRAHRLAVFIIDNVDSGKALLDHIHQHGTLPRDNGNWNHGF